jgi:methyl-accepting chemotaxis protein
LFTGNFDSWMLQIRWGALPLQCSYLARFTTYMAVAQQAADAAPDITRRSEEREKDLVTFKIGARRRFRMLAAIGSTSFLLALFELVAIPVVVPVAIVITGIAINSLLTKVTTGGRHRVWHRYAFASFDVLLLCSPVVVFGGSGLVLVYLIAIVPYSFDRGRALGYYTAALAAALYVASRLAYWEMHPARREPITWTLVYALLLVFVSSQIVPIASKLIRRVRATRMRMYEAEHGDLVARADARYADELGFLERSFNRMLRQLGQLIGGVQRETVQVASLADQLAQSTQSLRSTGREFSETARGLAAQMDGAGNASCQ